MAITITRLMELPDPNSNDFVYDVTFYGDTIKTLVTRTPSLVDSWISDIERLNVHRLYRLDIGLDIKWRPSDSTSDHQNPPAILQLCVGRSCLIFQLLLAPEIPQSLRNFLNTASYTFLGTEIKRDAEMLSKFYGLEVCNAVDIRKVTAQDWLQPLGLVFIAREKLGKEFEKPKDVTLSNWDDESLSLDQIKYACVDAFVSFEIGMKLDPFVLRY